LGGESIELVARAYGVASTRPCGSTMRKRLFFTGLTRC